MRLVVPLRPGPAPAPVRGRRHKGVRLLGHAGLLGQAGLRPGQVAEQRS